MPWDPMRDLLTMQERLESLFGQATPGWVPPVDLAELDDRYVLTVELPGLTRADVQIDYHDQVLTIRGDAAGARRLLPGALPAARARAGPVLAIVPVRRARSPPIGSRPTSWTAS